MTFDQWIFFLLVVDDDGDADDEQLQQPTAQFGQGFKLCELISPHATVTGELVIVIVGLTLN